MARFRVPKTVGHLSILVSSWLALSPSSVLASPTDEAAFHARVKALYDFRPRDLDSAHQQQKSEKLDKFWKDVRAQPSLYAPLLRAELTRADHVAYFYFDGSSLLTEISKTPADLQTVAAALRRVEMPDVSDDGYFNLVHRLGAQGVDILDLVQPMLDDPKFKVFVPAHAWTMDQRMAVTSCLLLLEPKRVVDSLGARLRREKVSTVAKTLIVALAWTVTDEASKVLQDYALHPTLPALATDARTYSRFESQAALPKLKLSLRREQFDAHLKAFMDRKYSKPGIDMERFLKEAAYLVRKADLPQLRSLRRERAARVSNEAWEEIEFLTSLMQYAHTATN